MSELLSFFVSGIPETQGGMREVSTPAGPRLVTTGSAGLTHWRKKVTTTATAARLAAQHTTFTNPVTIILSFFLPMPASRPAAVRHRGIGPSAVKPDLDKLIRAVGDSLTEAAVYVDDSRVMGSVVHKWEVADRSLCGVTVTVGEPDVTDDKMIKVLQARVAIPARISELDAARASATRARRTRRHR